jgi:phage-related protein
VYKVTVASGQTAISLTVGGATLTVTDLTAGGVYWIDCAAMEVWNSDRTALMTRYSAGDFPELAPGDNTVTFTGCSSNEIEKRERYL